MAGVVEVDLHLHTTHSDGTLTPSELVQFCYRKGLKVIAVTDHDSTEGVAQSLKTARDLGGPTVIPGIELSAAADGLEVHLLGYYLDHQDIGLQSVLTGLRSGREERARQMVDRLKEIGVPVSWGRVVELSAGGAIGRPHLAQAMVEEGYVQYPREAFDRFLGRDGPAYVGRVQLSPTDAVGLVLEHGGVPVMAHPTFSLPEAERADLTRLEPALQELREAGLAGVEVYYKDYTEKEVNALAEIAEKVGLVPCGGSDYHASGNPDEPEPGVVGPPMASVERLQQIAGQDGPSPPVRSSKTGHRPG